MGKAHPGRKNTQIREVICLSLRNGGVDTQWRGITEIREGVRPSRAPGPR